MVIPLWGMLGVYRGAQWYNYKCNYSYKNNDNLKKQQCCYSKCALMSLTGLAIYLFPIALPITIGKELYRLDVNIRNLTNEKETPTYYEII